jgi:serine/threonine-protein kinase
MIITYCLNPVCTHPKNHPLLKFCRSCGWSLILYARYRAIKKIGQGGFGTTFVGIDLISSENSLCVIKQLRPDTDDGHSFTMALDLFKREAKTLGRINHPQIPKLLNYFYENQQFYLIQELIQGEDLQKEVKKNGVFLENGVKYFLAEMLPILQYIHSQKVIHRDIKPANIIRRQQDGKLMLIDFGAVKDRVNTQLVKTDGDTALTKFSVGTKGYASPEQLALRPVYASDIYGLGATCLYLLTGQSPQYFEYDSKTGHLLWEKKVSISPGLTKIFNKMLELDLRKRYQLPEEVIKDLDIIPFEQSLSQSLLTKTTAVKKPRTATSSPNAQFTNSQFTSNTSATQKLKQAIAQRKSSKKNHNIQKKWDRETFLAAYCRGKRDFSYQNLPNLNLGKIELCQFTFRYSQLEGIVLPEANLSQANFYGANLSKAILAKANLQKSCLSTSNLQNADLRGANLINANLSNANLQAANLCGANLKNAQVEKQQLNQAKTDWTTIYPDGHRRWWKLLAIVP